MRAASTRCSRSARSRPRSGPRTCCAPKPRPRRRSEEHTSELQSLRHLVCRLLLEKKKQKINRNIKHKKKNEKTTVDQIQQHNSHMTQDSIDRQVTDDRRHD